MSEGGESLGTAILTLDLDDSALRSKLKSIKEEISALGSTANRSGGKGANGGDGSGNRSQRRSAERRERAQGFAADLAQERRATSQRVALETQANRRLELQEVARARSVARAKVAAERQAATQVAQINSNSIAQGKAEWDRLLSDARKQPRQIEIAKNQRFGLARRVDRLEEQGGDPKRLSSLRRRIGELTDLYSNPFDFNAETFRTAREQLAREVRLGEAALSSQRNQQRKLRQEFQPPNAVPIDGRNFNGTAVRKSPAYYADIGARRGGAAESIDALANAKRDRFTLSQKINRLEIEGVNVSRLRASLGELTTSYAQRQFGTAKQLTRELQKQVKQEQDKLSNQRRSDQLFQSQKRQAERNAPKLPLSGRLADGTYAVGSPEFNRRAQEAQARERQQQKNQSVKESLKRNSWVVGLDQLNEIRAQQQKNQSVAQSLIRNSWATALPDMEELSRQIAKNRSVKNSTRRLSWQQALGVDAEELRNLFRRTSFAGDLNRRTNWRNFLGRDADAERARLMRRDLPSGTVLGPNLPTNLANQTRKELNSLNLSLRSLQRRGGDIAQFLPAYQQIRKDFSNRNTGNVDLVRLRRQIEDVKDQIKFVDVPERQRTDQGARSKLNREEQERRKGERQRRIAEKLRQRDEYYASGGGGGGGGPIGPRGPFDPPDDPNNRPPDMGNDRFRRRFGLERPTRPPRPKRRFNFKSAIESGVIGGAFPLLFGQGIGASAGGLIGGVAGGLAGGAGGFAGSLVGTALGSQFDIAAQKARTLAQALESPIAAFDKLKDAALLSSKAVEKRAEKLIAEGRPGEAKTLIEQDIAGQYGDTSAAREQLKRTDRLNRNWNRVQVNADKALLPFKEFFTNIALAITGAPSADGRVSIDTFRQQLGQRTPEQRAQIQAKQREMMAAQFQKRGYFGSAIDGLVGSGTAEQQAAQLLAWADKQFGPTPARKKQLDELAAKRQTDSTRIRNLDQIQRRIIAGEEQGNQRSVTENQLKLFDAFAQIRKEVTDPAELKSIQDWFNKNPAFERARLEERFKALKTDGTKKFKPSPALQALEKKFIEDQFGAGILSRRDQLSIEAASGQVLGRSPFGLQAMSFRSRLNDSRSAAALAETELQAAEKRRKEIIEFNKTASPSDRIEVPNIDKEIAAAKATKKLADLEFGGLIAGFKNLQADGARALDDLGFDRRGLQLSRESINVAKDALPISRDEIRLRREFSDPKLFEGKYGKRNRQVYEDRLRSLERKRLDQAEKELDLQEKQLGYQGDGVDRQISRVDEQMAKVTADLVDINKTLAANIDKLAGKDWNVYVDVSSGEAKGDMINGLTEAMA